MMKMGWKTKIILKEFLVRTTISGKSSFYCHSGNSNEEKLHMTIEKRNDKKDPYWMLINNCYKNMKAFEPNQDFMGFQYNVDIDYLWREYSNY